MRLMEKNLQIERSAIVATLKTVFYDFKKSLFSEYDNFCIGEDGYGLVIGGENAARRRRMKTEKYHAKFIALQKDLVEFDREHPEVRKTA